MTQRGLKVEQQKPLPVVYREVKLDCGYCVASGREGRSFYPLGFVPQTGWREALAQGIAWSTKGD